MLIVVLLTSCSGSSYDLKPGEIEGYQVFREYCGQCHRLPKARQHTAEDWAAVVERMHIHMVEMKRKVISDEETTKLLVFLRGHAAP